MDTRLLAEKCHGLFGARPLIVRAPGRVNLIGEHTDYNNGFVLPAAIDKAVYMAVSKREDDELQIVSHDLNQTYKGSVSQLERSSLHWPDYILGVIHQLQQRGHRISGFNCLFGGDIPLGAGLSSSAALECATAFALNELFDFGLDRLSLVQLAQKAENEFVGVQCGIMDQFASMFGKKNHVIKLDCRSLLYEYVPFELKGIKIVLFDTGVKHSLASSEYNTRRQQCEAGVEMIRLHHPEVQSLRDVCTEWLDRYVAPKDEVIYQCCRYVVEENKRLVEACQDLEKGELEAFGKKMFATHEGLREQYRVSCAELDFLVHHVRTHPAVLGARMMGGGFGGCTINLVREEAIPALTESVSHAYQQAMHQSLKTYITQIENGTSLMEAYVHI